MSHTEMATKMLKRAKPSKYKAVKTTVDGIVFDSKKEAQRYHELKLMEKSGKIKDLRLQVPFPLCVEAEAQNTPRQCVGNYVADFIYRETNSAALIVEDVKGFKTPLYKWKKRHVEAQYGIQIREV